MCVVQELRLCVCSPSGFLDRKNISTKFCLPRSWNSRWWQILLLSMAWVPWR